MANNLQLVRLQNALENAFLAI